MASKRDYRRGGTRLLSIAATFLVGLVMTGLAGCGGSVKWKEEVQLGNGRIIVIDQEVITEWGGDEWAHNPSGSKPKEYRIRMTYPLNSNGSIEWRSVKKSPATYPELPLILDIESNQPVVFTAVYVDPICVVYTKYVYRNGLWEEETLPETFGERTPNLLIGSGSGIISLKTKLEKNDDIRYPKIIRKVGPSRKECHS